MKSINVTYDSLGRVSEITSEDTFPHLIEAEAGTVCINVLFPVDYEGYNVQAYIKNSAGGDVVELGTLALAEVESEAAAETETETETETEGDTVTETPEPVLNPVVLTFESKHLVKGNLYIGFEVYKDNVYARFEKLRFDINSFVDVSKEMSEGLGDYTVTVYVGEVSLTDSDSLPSVTNSGTKRNVVLDFAFPRNVTFLPVLDGTVLKWVRKDVSDEVDTTTFDLTGIVPTKVSELENDSGYLTEHQDISGKMDKSEVGSEGTVLVNDGTGGAENSSLSVGDIATLSFVSKAYYAREYIDNHFWKTADGKAYVDEAIPTKVSELENDSGYLTEHQDISGKVDHSANENGGIRIGEGSSVGGEGISIGKNSKGNDEGVAIGFNAEAKDGAIAIGWNADANINYAIQLGVGENNLPYTLQVFEFQLLNDVGEIPIERLQLLKNYTDEAIPAKVSELENDSGFISENSGGGFSAGEESKVGDNHNNPGGAIGRKAFANWGFAGGCESHTNGGASAGYCSWSYDGGAVGKGASTGNGFAGGMDAKAQDETGNGLDAIQLGTGINSTPKTFQVYDYLLMKETGNIPIERLGEIMSYIQNNYLTSSAVMAYVDEAINKALGGE